MFSLFAGRLKLRYEILSHQWIADVIVGPRKHQSISVELGTRDLQAAKDMGISFYKAFKAEHGGDALTCWDCQQYSPETRGCQVGVPECRRTGGRFAVNCDLFLAIKH